VSAPEGTTPVREPLAVHVPEILARYPEGRQRSAVMPLLRLAQERDGWVTSEAISEIADIIGLSSAEVLAVASFYTMFRLTPKGRHVISVCHNRSCDLLGAEDVIARVREELGIGRSPATGTGAGVGSKTVAENGAGGGGTAAVGTGTGAGASSLGAEENTSPDGQFTLERAECLAHCDAAPVVQIDDDRMVGPVTPDDVAALLAELRSQPEGPQPRAVPDPEADGGSHA
jgi:NADH-quinone oxidoreductase subunit E